MPSAEEWTKNIRSQWGSHPKGCSTSSNLREVERALQEHPSAAALWILRGHLIQACDEILDDYPLEEALRSYQEACRLEPSSPEPHVEIGHYLDAIADDPAQAVPHFRKAVELGGGRAAAKGLADAFSQLDGSAGHEDDHE